MATATEIPIIDINAPDEDQAQVAKQLVEAAITHGFIYIRNTDKDIPAAAIDEAFELSRKLFSAPLEEKQKCSIQKNNRGWSGMGVETLDPKNQRVGDLKEAFNVGDFVDGKAQQPIPPTIAPYEGQLAAFQERCYQLCLKINALLGIGLDVQPTSFFTSAHVRPHGTTSSSILRLLYYPPVARTPAETRSDVRAGAHSDYGSVTLLFRLRGQAGLEMQTRDGHWAPVPVVPPGTEGDAAPPVLVNIGDLLSYWTNGLLRSTVHRVVFPGAGAAVAPGEGDGGEEGRYSIAFFCHPVGDTPLTPVPSERVRSFKGGAGDGRDGEGKVLTADEHLHMRLRASYLQLYGDKPES